MHKYTLSSAQKMTGGDGMECKAHAIVTLQPCTKAEDGLQGSWSPRHINAGQQEACQ